MKVTVTVDAKELVDLIDVLEKMLNATKDVDDIILFKSLLGAFVDNWGAIHGVHGEELFSIFEDLAVIQRKIHSDLGEVALDKEKKS